METIKDKLLDGETWVYSPPKYTGYAFSNMGRCYSLRHNKFLTPVKTPYKNNVLYNKITLYNCDNCKRYLVHRIIAELFCVKPGEECSVVHHINGIATDNRACNLMWVTQKQHKLIHSEMRKNSK